MSRKSDSLPAHWPVLGICGDSGSGKTTLIEKLIPRMGARGLAIAVVKHDAHGMALDTPGKDTDRLFRAGATVFAHDPGQSFTRRSPGGGDPLPAALDRLLQDHDLVLVEGHKQTPLPAKIWLESPRGAEAPADCGPFRMTLGRDADRAGEVARLLDEWLPRQLQRRPLRAGLLLGGTSRRMGQPKQLMEHRGRSWAELAAEALLAHTDELCLLGGGEVPAVLAGQVRLPDAPGPGGPIAGMMSALRWDPEAAWIFAACDMPLLTADAVGWVLEQRGPGRWAVLPRRSGAGVIEAHVEPLGAWYDPRMRGVLAGCDRPSGAAGHRCVVTPAIPAKHEAAWRSFNTPEDLAGLD